jgi:hypothetical protein
MSHLSHSCCIPRPYYYYYILPWSVESEVSTSELPMFHPFQTWRTSSSVKSNLRNEEPPQVMNACDHIHLSHFISESVSSTGLVCWGPRFSLRRKCGLWRPVEYTASQPRWPQSMLFLFPTLFIRLAHLNPFDFGILIPDSMQFFVL